MTSLTDRIESRILTHGLGRFSDQNKKINKIYFILFNCFYTFTLPVLLHVFSYSVKK